MATVETYLKTQQVASALGVSVSTIKRWVDSGAIEATRTMGKHRLVLLSSALKFAKNGQFPVSDLLALKSESSPAVIDGRLLEALADLLKVGRVREASALIVSAYSTNQGAAFLADQLIQPLMDRVGHGWMIGSWDVYQEHQATHAVASALSELNTRLSVQTIGPRPLALGAAPEGDPYLLPGLLGELVVREVGWDVKYLGTNLPMRSLAQATRDYRPGLVYLSVSHLADPVYFLREYSYFYESATQVGAAIILGGRALDAVLRQKLVYASFGERMAHLAEFARRLLPATDHPGTMNNSI